MRGETLSFCIMKKILIIGLLFISCKNKPRVKEVTFVNYTDEQLTEIENKLVNYENIEKN